MTLKAGVLIAVALILRVAVGKIDRFCLTLNGNQWGRADFDIPTKQHFKRVWLNIFVSLNFIFPVMCLQEHLPPQNFHFWHPSRCSSNCTLQCQHVAAFDIYISASLISYWISLLSSDSVCGQITSQQEVASDRKVGDVEVHCCIQCGIKVGCLISVI